MKIIILHDADARIEFLDVIDHLIGNDIEDFLITHGFSVNNITWFAISADHVPVVFHKYGIDRRTGESTHVRREAKMRDLSVHEQTTELKHREQEELVAAIRQHGEMEEGQMSVHFDGEQPIVAGYLYDEPCDIVITAARVDANGQLTLMGEEKGNRGEQLLIDPDEIFGGQLDYVTSNVKAWNK